jgi:hypothetical protein
MSDPEFKALFKKIGISESCWQHANVGKEIGIDGSWVQCSPWLQSTGLLDKKGIKIFKGDIGTCNKVDYQVIRHKSGAYELHRVDKKDGQHFLFHACKHIEITGNIYEDKK